MSFLRELGIGIGFNVDSGPLKQADSATDQFKEKILDGTDYTEEFGIKIEEVGELATESFEMAGTSAEEMGVQIEGAMMDAEDSAGSAEGAVKDLGEQATRSGREASSAFGEVADTFGEVGSQASAALSIIKGGIAGIMATGFLGMLVSAATTLETAGFRAQWFADEVEGGFDTLTDAIGRTVKMSRGLHAEGELLAAANQAMQVGASVEFIADSFESAAIISARTGKDIGNVMHQLGRAVEIGSIRQLMEMGVITEEHFAAMGEEVTQSIRGWEKHRREMLIQIATQDTLTRHGERYNDYLETSGAQLGILRSELGNIAEVMGQPILGPMNKFVGYLSDILKWAQDDPIGQTVLKFLGWATAIGTLSIGALGLVKALGALKVMLLPILVPFLKFAAIGIAVALIVDDLITAFFGLGDSVTETVFDAVMGFLGFDITFQEFRESVIKGLVAIRDWFVNIWDAITHAWQTGEGFLGDLLHGLFTMFQGWIMGIANLFKMGFGLIWGIFTGDWSMLKDGFRDYLGALGQIWDGFMQIISRPLDWATDKITGWVDSGLGLIDRLVQGFLNIPGTIKEGLSGFGDMLKDTITKPLKGLRNMLPFSPAKEGPLVDLHESGYNILGNISEGMDSYGRLDIGSHVDMLEPEIIQSRQQNEAEIERTTRAMAGTSSGGVVSGSSSTEQAPQFHTTLKIEYSGTASEEANESLVNMIDRRLRQIYQDLMDEYFRKMAMKRANLAER